MKNFEELLKDIGIDIPDDKKEEFEKTFHENYKTIAEVEKLKTKLETSQGDNENLNEQLGKATENLKELETKLKASGEDAEVIKELQAQLAQANKERDEEIAKAKEQQKHDAYVKKVEDAMKDLKFSSESAKETFTNKAIDKKFAVDEEGNLMGFTDFVNGYKAKDSGAFVEKTDINLGGKSEKVDDPKSPSSTEKRHAF